MIWKGFKMDHSKHRHYEYGVALMLLYALAMSLFGLFSKMVLTLNGLFLFLFSRYFLTLLVVLPFLFLMGTFKEVTFGRHLWPQVARAFIVMLSLNLFFYCLINTSLFAATVLYNTGPLFIPILAKFLFKAPVHKKVWWSLTIGFLGVILVLKPDSWIFSIYSLAGLLSGLGVAFSSILYSNAAREGGGRLSLALFYFLLLSSIFSGILLLVFNGLYKKDLAVIINQLFFMDWNGWLAMAVTIICLIINQNAKGYAYRFAPVQRLAPFMYTIVVFSGIFDWLIFNNPPHLYTLIGSAFVISGVLLELRFQKS